MTALKDYGWVGVFVYFVVKELWPFFKNSVFPAQMRAQKEAKELKNKQLAWDHEMDERRVRAMENATAAILKHSKGVDDALLHMSEVITNQNAQIVLAITVSNERMTQLVDAHHKHDSFTIQTMGEIRSEMHI